MSDQKAPARVLVIGALLAVQILFGLGYVVSKVVVQHFPPLVWASIRIIISTTIMFGFAFKMGGKHPKPDRHFFGPLVIFACLGIIFNQSSFLVGLKYTTATNSAILNTLIPIFTLLLVTLRRQEPLTSHRFIGFVSSFAGVLILRKVEQLSLSDQTLIGDLLTILNCFSYALFLSYSKKFLERYSRVWTTAWMFAYGSVGLSLIALPDYATFQWPEMTPFLWSCVAFNIIGTTILTYFLNFWALAHAKSSHVALFIYIQPVIAATVAYFAFGEVLTFRTIASSGLIFVGVLIAMSRESAKAVPAGSAVSAKTT